MWKYVLLWIFLVFHAISDIKTRKINVIVCILFGIAGMIFFICNSERDVLSLTGGLMAGAYLLVFSFLTKEAVGVGDGIVVMATGIWLGGVVTFAVLMGGFVLAALFGLMGICTQKATGKTELAFIPFFTISYTVFCIGGFL